MLESKLSDYPSVTMQDNDQTRTSHRNNDIEQGPYSEAASVESADTTTRPVDAQSVHSMHAVTARRSPEPSTINTPGERAITQRLLRPRYLCIVDDSDDRGYRVVAADDQHDLYTVPYVFISYTRRQFYTQITGDPSLTNEDLIKRQLAAQRDAATLISLALTAVERAGVAAFWIDFECVHPEEPGDAEASRSIEDVYRICDIVRASHSIAIMVYPSLDDNLDHSVDDFSPASQRSWLLEWGQRLWTLPEALLCPSNHGIAIYLAGKDEPKLEVIDKRNLAVYVWEDASTVSQLIDHYEGSVRLSQLELISIALESFQRRQTAPRMRADAIYALMGLMRERLSVRPDDTAFQAFARLSLINDSAKPLERLLCVHPRSPTASWHSTQDFWGAKLWDITPECQIAEVAAGDTVVLGDMYGALIDWEPLSAIDFMLTPTASHKRIWTAVRLVRSAWAFGLLTVLVAVTHSIVFQLTSLRSSDKVVRWIFGLQLALVAVPPCLFLVLSLIISSTVTKLYRGPIQKVQARFYGFRGIADLETAERVLFGVSDDRMSWSEYNPIESPGGDEVDGGDVNAHRLFTLVDTWSMTASTFRARNPPSTVMVCGKQGGLLRTLLCSYEEHSKTFCRETVLRMETKVLHRMFRMDRCRLSLTPMERYSDTEVA